jgi:hypothetical protein
VHPSRNSTEVFVKRTLLAAALAATAAITMPMLVGAAENSGTQQTQVAPLGEKMGADPAGADQASADQRMRGMGDRGMGDRGLGDRGIGERRMGSWPMMRQMMMRRMMGGDPQERCIERLAWRAARRAYVEAKLDLTPAQRPLWDKVQSIAQGEQQKERQLCQSLKPREESTVLDRLDRAQQLLSARLDALQSAKPAVQALYQALTPEQRAVMDHPFRR